MSLGNVNEVLSLDIMHHLVTVSQDAQVVMEIMKFGILWPNTVFELWWHSPSKDSSLSWKFLKFPICYF